MKNSSSSKKDDRNIKNRKKYFLKHGKGFTLVEVLAMIAILSLVLSIVIYTIFDVLDDAKEKSYQVTINNIQKEAITYVFENSDKVQWVTNATTSNEYQCVSVQDLIEMGYFKGDILESKISDTRTVEVEDLIYLERDGSSKTINQSILLSSPELVNDFSDYCNHIMSAGSIDFYVEPALGIWTKSKEVKINYEFWNNDIPVGEFKYDYDASEVVTSGGVGNLPFTSNQAEVSVSVVKNGNIIANIKHGEQGIAMGNLEIKKVDSTKPTISVSVDDALTYSKSKTASVTLKDNNDGSGFKMGNYQIKYDWSLTPLACSQLTKRVGVKIDNNNQLTGTADILLWGDDLTGPGKLYICAEDITDFVGNDVETELISTDAYLDNTAPTITFGTNGNSSYTKSVSSTINVRDDHSSGDTTTYKYIYSTNNSANPTTTFVSGSNYSLDSVTGIYYLVACACDKAGNCATVSSRNFLLDNTGPIITYGTNGNTNYVKSVSSTITVRDEHAGGDAATYKYIYSQNSGANPTTVFTSGNSYSHSSGTGDYYLVTYACDRLGNCTRKVSNKFLLDNTKPTITFGTNGNSSYVKSVSSTINVRDEHSGGDAAMYKYIYSQNSGANPSTAFTSGNSYSHSSGTGIYYLVAYACDKAGNCEKTNSKEFYLDNTSPSKPVIDNPTNGNWTKANFALKLSTVEEHSGVDYWQYTYNVNATSTGSDYSTSWKTYSNSSSSNFTTTEFSAERNQNVYVRACDKAGNCSEKNNTMIRIDKSKPTIGVSNKYNNADYNGDWVNGNITSSITFSDGGSGIKASSLAWACGSDSLSSIDNSSASSYTDTWTAERNSSTCYYRICDNVDNCVDSSKFTIKIDKTNPTIIFDPNGSSYYAKSVSSKISVSDSASGGDATTYKYVYSTSSDANPLTAFTSGNSYLHSSGTGTYYLVAYACDNAGNCQKTSSKGFLLDNTAPTKPVIDNPTNGNWTKTNFALKLSTVEEHSGVDYWQYTYNSNATETGSDSKTNWVTYSNSSSTKFTTTEFSAERNQNVYVRACDKVGNCSEKASTMIKIDKSKPTISVSNKYNNANYNGTWVNNNITSEISFSDSGSGIKASSLGWACGNASLSSIENSNTSSYKDTWNSERNDSSCYYRICDNLGQCSDSTGFAIKIDKTKPTKPTISLDSSGNIVISGSTDKFPTNSKLTYKGSTTSGKNYVANFTNPTSSATVYGVAVDEAGNISDEASKSFISLNAQTGRTGTGTDITYTCSLNSNVYSTQSAANNDCKTTDTKKTEVNYTYSCPSGYTCSDNTCRATSSCIKCSDKYTCNKGTLSGIYCVIQETKTTTCICGVSAGGTDVMTAECGVFPNCSSGYTNMGESYNGAESGYMGCVNLGGTGSYTAYRTCQVTVYATATPTCDNNDKKNVISNPTYSCPSGYTTTSSTLTANTNCTKTVNGTVNRKTDAYYTCSLFSGQKYNSSSAATTACTNYCSNSSTKYYSGKNKCIGLK